MAPAYLHAQPSDFVATVAGVPLQPHGDGTLRAARGPRRKRGCPRCAEFGSGDTCDSGSGGARYCSRFDGNGSPKIGDQRKRARSARPCQRCVTAGKAQQAT
eukprot:465941-Prymnesium_polylepis.1